MDALTKYERSLLMGRVRGRGNDSTECAVVRIFRREGIHGWRRHLATVTGCPDFYFPAHRVALFVDGCFWHGCPICGRLPKSRVAFWRTKIGRNKIRDRHVRSKLRGRGVSVLRVWEHEIRTRRWVDRLRVALSGSPRSVQPCR